MGAGAWGTALAKVLADAGSDVTLWARRPELADEINDTHRNTGYLGDVDCPRRSARPATPPKHLTARARCCWRCRRRRCGPISKQWKDADRRRRHAGEPGQGHRAGHADADESGHRAGDRCRPVPGSRRHRTEPRQRDRAGAARRHRRRLHRLRAGGDDAAGAVHRLLPALHQRRRDRRRNRRSMQERHRSRLRDGRGCRAGGEHRRRDHHPWAGRDHAARNRVGSQARDAGRARRHRRSRGHLHLTALTQPVLRGAAGQGRHHGAALAAAGGHVAEGVTSCESVLALAASYDVEMPLTDAVHRVCHQGLSVDQAVALLLGRSTKPE